jgi:hypothetical protein
MSKNSNTCIDAYANPALAQELDAIRGDIPRSRILERALIRYLDDLKEGQVSIVPPVNKKAEAAAIKLTK